MNTTTFITIQPNGTGRRGKAGSTAFQGLALLVAMVVGMGLIPQVVGAADESRAELTAEGKTLLDHYSAMLESLKAEIEKQLPEVDDAKVAAWKAAIKADEA